MVSICLLPLLIGTSACESATDAEAQRGKTQGDGGGGSERILPAASQLTTVVQSPALPCIVRSEAGAGTLGRFRSHRLQLMKINSPSPTIGYEKSLTTEQVRMQKITASNQRALGVFSCIAIQMSVNCP